jgi:hypothetical protein
MYAHLHLCAQRRATPLYRVNLTFSFNNLVRRYAPNLDPVVYGVPMDPEELGGLSDRHVLL